MKTYAITLCRAVERKEHIEAHLRERQLDYEIVEAVDGSLLSEEELTKLCDIDQVNKYPWWLTRGAIGCALSHQKVCQKIAESGKAALVVEDDVYLPADIEFLLKEIESQIRSEEVILLYYTSFQKALLSTSDSVALSKGKLLYPMDINNTMTTTAYVIGIEAAKKMSQGIKPVCVTADTWNYFYEQKFIGSLRVHYPSVIKTKNFKFSIDYMGARSLKEKITRFINAYNIPFLYQILQFIRAKKLYKMLNQYSLTDQESPVSQNLKR